MIIHREFEQQSVQWFEIRAGKVTASEMGRLVTDKGAIRKGDGPRTFLLEKLAEKWMDDSLPQFKGSFLMDQGNALEDYARPAFELETGLKVTRVGFIESDDHRCGCSPDAMIGETEGLEIKSPGIVNHLRYMLDGVLPEDFILQVQTSIFVTGFKTWKFCSFRRGCAPLILTIERDEKIQQAIAEAMELFTLNLNDEWKRLCALNGGPPPKRKKFVPMEGKPKFTWEQSEDVIP